MKYKMSSSKRPKVEHVYRNFSHYFEDGGNCIAIKQKAAGRNFPAKLHSMLSNPQYSHIISWMPHGRAFKFTRQLSGWGFKRLYFSGPDLGAYYHEKFLRGMPELTMSMTREKSIQGKHLPNPEGEPDLYMISRLHPLPMVDNAAQALAASKPSAVVQPLTAEATNASGIAQRTNVVAIANQSHHTASRNEKSALAANLPNVNYNNMTSLGNASAQDSTSGKAAAPASYALSRLGYEDSSKSNATAEATVQVQTAQPMLQYHTMSGYDTPTRESATTTITASSSLNFSTTSEVATTERGPSDAVPSVTDTSSALALSASWPGTYQMMSNGSQPYSFERYLGTQPRQPPQNLPYTSSLGQLGSSADSSGSDNLPSTSSLGQLGRRADGNESSSGSDGSFKRDMNNLLENFPFPF